MIPPRMRASSPATRRAPARSIVAIAALLVCFAGAAAVAAPASPSARAIRATSHARTFTVLATGDILAEAPVRAVAATAGAATGVRYSFDGILAPVAPVIAAADLAICHLEVPLGRPGQFAGTYGRSASAGNLLLGPYELAADLAEAGFDRCSTASNHSWDLGTEGIDATLAAADAAGLTHVGTARSPEEAAARSQWFLVNGVRVAHLSFTTYSNTGSADAGWQLDMASSAAPMIAAVDAARAAGAEVVIVSLHTLKELLSYPIDIDRARITQLVKQADVDLVIQHGPHVIQGVERIGNRNGGTWVYWSLGNFLTGMGEASDARYGARGLDGLLGWARFTERPDQPGRFTVEPVPVLICTQPITRVIRPALPTLGLADLDPALRAQLEACVARTLPVVPTIR